jgi:hypothetical protein
VKGGKEWEATFQLAISSFHSNFHLQSSHNLIKLFFIADPFAQPAENVIKLFPSKITNRPIGQLCHSNIIVRFVIYEKKVLLHLPQVVQMGHQRKKVL